MREYSRTLFSDPPADPATTQDFVNRFGRYAELVLDEAENPGKFHPYRRRWVTDLKSIERFTREPMIHRGSDFQHVARVESLVALMVSDLTQTEPNDPQLNSPKALLQAIEHDDAETDPKIGDIPTPEKLQMTDAERARLQEREEQAAKEAATRYIPNEYRDLYIANHKEEAAKNTIESQLVDIADMWDGLGQTLHDIRCGNTNPEIFQVLERYQHLFKGLERHAVWEKFKDNSYFGLNSIPTPEETLAMSQVRFEDLQADFDKAMLTVCDPNLPAIYKRWLWVSLSKTHMQGTFPGWKDRFKKKPVPFEFLDRIAA